MINEKTYFNDWSNTDLINLDKETSGLKFDNDCITRKIVADLYPTRPFVEALIFVRSLLCSEIASRLNELINIIHSI